VGGAGELGAGEHGGSSGGVLVAEDVVLVEGVEFDFLEGFLVAGELVEVVPSHGVHVG